VLRPGVRPPARSSALSSDRPTTGRDWYPWKVLSVTSLGNLLVFTNTTSVNVALPAISADLAVSAATADWFLLSFMVSMTMFVMVFGRISDILGRRRLYLGGLVVMTLASVAAALAQEPGMLIAMRLLQGVAAASIITNANAQVADAFPPRLLATGLSVNVMMASVASVLGPGLGGVLVTAWGWRSLFLVNVPFGMLGVLLGVKVLRSARAEEAARERFDVAGAAISAGGLAALLLGINRSSVWGWADPRVFLLMGSSLLAFVIFAMVERKVAHPLVDVSLIHDRSRGLAYCTALLMSLAQSGVVVMVALHEQLVRQASAAAAGVAAVPVALALAVCSPVGAQLSRLLSARSVSSLGAACATAGYAMLAWYFGGSTAHGPLVAALADRRGRGNLHFAEHRVDHGGRTAVAARYREWGPLGAVQRWPGAGYRADAVDHRALAWAAARCGLRHAAGRRRGGGAGFPRSRHAAGGVLIGCRGELARSGWSVAGAGASVRGIITVGSRPGKVAR
jgi:EmrB/QacA subfamily drug resistance transporter